MQIIISILLSGFINHRKTYNNYFYYIYVLSSSVIYQSVSTFEDRHCFAYFISKIKMK